MAVLFAFAVAAILLGAGFSPAHADEGEGSALKAGDPAPAFSLPGSDGKTYTLEEFRGKKAVVIAWFPKAFTGG
jgi:peroxiredoxin Q/BCP